MRHQLPSVYSSSQDFIPRQYFQGTRTPVRCVQEGPEAASHPDGPNLDPRRQIPDHPRITEAHGRRR